MAFEKEKFEVARKVDFNKGEITVECNLSAGSSVAKVLSLSVEGYVLSSETLNGVVNYSGAVDLKLVVLGEDGEINSTCSTCPFSSKFEGNDIQNGQDAFVKVKVIDYNVESIGGEMVKVGVMLEQSGFIVGNKEVSCLACHDDDVCLKQDEITLIKYLGTSNGEATVESEINLRENIKKVLLTESHVIVKNVDSGVGFVTVSGDIISRVLYMNEDDKFESGYLNDTFKEEVELASCTRESFVEGDAYVKQEAVVTEIVQDEKGGKIVVKVPVTISVRAYEEEKRSVIQDLYSTKNDINVTTESFSMTQVSPLDVVEGKIEGSLTLEEEHPRVDKLLFNGGNSLTVTNAFIKDGEIIIEGIAKTSAVYLNDEDSSLHSVQLDVPFILSDKFNEEEGGNLYVDATLNDVDVVVKKGREIYYDAKVKASVNYCHDMAQGVISDAAALEEYGKKDFAMEVIFAPAGNDLWTVAKKARVKEEQIVAQNPEVVFPTTDDTPLVLFYQRVE